ncbi:hypothetical protein VTK56DRAFT_9193 [Thermocarpiscus australiensis]
MPSLPSICNLCHLYRLCHLTAISAVLLPSYFHAQLVLFCPSPRSFLLYLQYFRLCHFQTSTYHSANLRYLPFLAIMSLPYARCMIYFFAITAMACSYGHLLGQGAARTNPPSYMTTQTRRDWIPTSEPRSPYSIPHQTAGGNERTELQQLSDWSQCTYPNPQGGCSNLEAKDMTAVSVSSGKPKCRYMLRTE